MSNTETKAAQLPPEFFQDPYPFYRAWFEQSPVLPMQYLDGVDCMYTSGYQEVETVLKDSRFVSDIAPYLPENQKENWMGRGQSIPDAWMPLINMQRNWMLLRDGADHARLRGPVVKTFTPQVIDRVRPHIEEISHQLLDGLKGKDSIDLIADYAFALPVIVIAELLGVPAADREKFKDWSTALIVTLDPHVTPEEMTQAALISVELMEYFRVLMNERKVTPQNDLISDMVKSGQMSDDELLAACVLLLVAGHETTVNLIGNGAATLLKNPDQLEKLVTDPTLYPNAIEEVLRFEPPVQITVRFASQDLEVGGQHVTLGTPMHLSLAGANRDPRVFENPDKFDVTRKNANRHLSFSAGAHYCVGANLARVEAQIALRVLFERMTEIEVLADPLEWNVSSTFRGLKSLPLRGKID